MRSSIGVHTASIFKKVTLKEAGLIYNDFEKYGKETKKLKIRPIRVGKVSTDADPFIRKLCSTNKQFYRMEYADKRKGIRWEMRRGNSSPTYIRMRSNDVDRPCSIKAKVTPRVMGNAVSDDAVCTTNPHA